jgi:hypothetical protein
MLRKIAIGLAAATIALGGLTLSAPAMRGGGPGFARAGGFAHGGRAFAGRRAFVGRRAFAMRGGTFRRAHFRRGRWWGGRRFGFVRGATWGGAGGSCWRWTPAGRVWVCGSGRGFGRAWGGGVWGVHHRGRVFGMRGGRRFR